MIDRPSRARLATALRQYVSGRITNDELDGTRIDRRDAGVAAVKQRAWCLYDDLYRHRAIGKYYLPKPARDEIGRWILFLHSDLEYAWPDFASGRMINWPLNLLTLGWWARNRSSRLKEFMESGDFSVWPFLARQDYANSLAAPKYLAGVDSPDKT
jgi:hypothetical protein